ncbi:Eukaryotic translation initiation factor 4 gamma 3 [Lamellibrachia satsuma]|nr:Eukaryotic translation initiation factor 4 gamma 3 [Lamellibrachia satsuma]
MLIVKQNVANEEVINWIEANVGEAQVKEPAFIRALMTAICSSAITGKEEQWRVDEEKVKKRLILLLKYLDHKETLELQALYALQILVHQLGHPPSVLRMFFDIFYDNSIITKDAFNQWEKSTDPAERAGRSAAKTSVKQFFALLHVTNKIREIDWLICSQNMANEEVIDWIEANVGEAQVKEPAFIRALMTAVCTSAIRGKGTQCRVDEEKVKKRLVLLLKYLDHKETLELQALYALQTLVRRLKHPPSVLRTFFDTFYDEDIISEDAFNQWEGSMDPAEQAGKGVAKTSVTQFFSWLHEAEEESEEDSSDCM